MIRLRDTLSGTELTNCYNSNTRTMSSVSLWKSSIIFHVKSGVSSWWILQDIKEIVKARLSKLSKEVSYSSSLLLPTRRLINILSWFPSPTPDLYEVAPSSTLLPISALPLHWKSPQSLQSLPCSLSAAYPLLSHLHESSLDECLHIK